MTLHQQRPVCIVNREGLPGAGQIPLPGDRASEPTFRESARVPEFHG
jgi:hypothetical protein